MASYRSRRKSNPRSSNGGSKYKPPTRAPSTQGGYRSPGKSSGTSSRGQSGTSSYGPTNETRASQADTKGYAKSREGSIAKPQPTIDYKSDIETVSVVKSPGPTTSTKESNYTGPSLKESLSQSNIDKVNTHYANNKDTTRSAGPTSSRSNRDNKRNTPKTNTVITSSNPNTVKLDSGSKSVDVTYTKSKPENKNFKIDSGSDSVVLTKGISRSKKENKTIVLDSGSDSVKLQYGLASENKIETPKEILNNFIFPDKPDTNKYGRETPAITYDNLQDKLFAGKQIPGLDKPTGNNAFLDRKDNVNDAAYGFVGSWLNIYHDVRAIGEGLIAESQGKDKNEVMSDYHANYHTGDFLDYAFQKSGQAISSIMSPDQKHDLYMYESDTGFLKSNSRMLGSALGTASQFVAGGGVGIAVKGLQFSTKTTSLGLKIADTVPALGNIASKIDTALVNSGLRAGKIEYNNKPYAESALGGKAEKLPEYKNTDYDVWVLVGEKPTPGNPVKAVGYRDTGRGKNQITTEYSIEISTPGTTLRMDTPTGSHAVNSNLISNSEVVLTQNKKGFGDRNKNKGYEELTEFKTDDVLPNSKEGSSLSFVDEAKKTISGVFSRDTTPNTALAGIDDSLSHLGKVTSRRLDRTGQTSGDIIDVTSVWRDKGITESIGTKNKGGKSPEIGDRDKGLDTIKDILKGIDADTAKGSNVKPGSNTSTNPLTENINTKQNNPFGSSNTKQTQSTKSGLSQIEEGGLIKDSITIVDTKKPIPKGIIDNAGPALNPFIGIEGSKTIQSPILDIDSSIDQDNIFDPIHEPIIKPLQEEIIKEENKIHIPQITKTKIKNDNVFGVAEKVTVGLIPGITPGLVPPVTGQIQDFDIPVSTFTHPDPLIDIPVIEEEIPFIIPPIIPLPIPINDKLAGSRSLSRRNNNLFSTNSDHNSFLGFINSKEVSYGNSRKSKPIKQFDFANKELFNKFESGSKKRSSSKYELGSILQTESSDNSEFTHKELFSSGESKSKSISKDDTKHKLDFLASKSSKNDKGFTLGNFSKSNDMNIFTKNDKSLDSIFGKSSKTTKKSKSTKKHNKKSKGFSL